MIFLYQIKKQNKPSAEIHWWYLHDVDVSCMFRLIRILVSCSFLVKTFATFWRHVHCCFNFTSGLCLLFRVTGPFFFLLRWVNSWLQAIYARLSPFHIWLLVYRPVQRLSGWWQKAGGDRSENSLKGHRIGTSVGCLWPTGALNQSILHLWWPGRGRALCASVSVCSGWLKENVTNEITQSGDSVADALRLCQKMKHSHNQSVSVCL